MEKRLSKTTVLIALYVLACAAADTAFAAADAGRNDHWPVLPEFTTYGFHFGQIVVLTLWCVCGHNKLLLRVVGTTLILMLFAVAGSYCRFGRPTEAAPWLGALTLYFAFLALPLSVARYFGFQLHSDGAVPAKSRPNSKYQFSVVWLFSLTTATAVVLTVARYMGFPWQELWAMVGVFAWLALNGLAVLSCAMLIRRPERATGATVLVLSASLILGVLIHSFTVSQLALRSARWFIAMFAAQGATVAVSALILRLAGLRFSRESLPSTTELPVPVPFKSEV
jgi:hypothetical protein